MFFISRGGAVW